MGEWEKPNRFSFYIWHWDWVQFINRIYTCHWFLVAVAVVAVSHTEIYRFFRISEREPFKDMKEKTIIIFFDFKWNCFSKYESYRPTTTTTPTKYIPTHIVFLFLFARQANFKCIYFILLFFLWNRKNKKKCYHLLIWVCVAEQRKTGSNIFNLQTLIYHGLSNLRTKTTHTRLLFISFHISSFPFVYFIWCYD